MNRDEQTASVTVLVKRRYVLCVYVFSSSKNTDTDREMIRIGLVISLETNQKSGSTQHLHTSISSLSILKLLTDELISKKCFRAKSASERKRKIAGSFLLFLILI